ncbi:mitochondrial 54S ribosomal protein mL58 [Lipomyces oligophaga]|uniref:mitochondrial 54S ribosomal protein mL58 n=1 Tax=Lipomyces oligophaga TaxID=45792 RepID=UPI0034CFA278
MRFWLMSMSMKLAMATPKSTSISKHISQLWTSTSRHFSSSRSNSSTTSAGTELIHAKSKVTKFKDPEKFRIPFPTLYNPKTAANRAAPILPPGLTYNPPPSSASPFDTPDIFVPASIRANIASLPCLKVLPPPLKTFKEKQYHLDDQTVEEIRRLRKQDPQQWTKKALSLKFGCSQNFVHIVCNGIGSDSGKASFLRKRNESRALWSPAKLQSRIHREKRKELWKTDD